MMAAMAAEAIGDPFTAFSFEVVLSLATPIDGVGDPVCQGAFSECDGIEVSIEPKTLVEGGANDRQIHLVGPVRYGQLTLRRGMTSTADLWAWMAAVTTPGRVVTADGHITMLDASGQEQAVITIEGCLPTRLRGPALNAQTGQVAVEELGLAVGRLTLGPGGGGGLGAGSGIGIGVGASLGAGAGISAGVGVQVSGGLGLSAQLGGTFSAGASAGVGVG